jgi:hypothetical protein
LSGQGEAGAATVHRVLLRASRRLGRILPALIAGLTLLGWTAACGADIGKANFQRTTVPAQPGSGGQGEVSTGAITDPAVAAAALREVDPCPLLAKDSLAELGTVGEPRPEGFDQCGTEVTDPGGKTIKLSLRLGDSVISVDQASGNVGGLALIERKQDTEGCFVTALTSRKPNLGIQVQVSYGGGDPCRPGHVVLQKVVKKLHEQPAMLPLAPGSLVSVDPCTVIDDAVLTEVLGTGADKSVTNLHTCSWSGRGPSLQLYLRQGYLPSADVGTTPVDLGGGVSGFQVVRAKDTAMCTIIWGHRPTSDRQGEVVSLDYTNYRGDAATDDACGKTMKLARNVVGKLPKP